MSAELVLTGPGRIPVAASAAASPSSAGGPFAWLQEVMGQVPELVQPLILVLAGAIPFFEGEGSVALGVFSGVHPVVAAFAAITGNVLCVAAVVWLGSWVRESIVARRRRRGAGEGPVPASDEVAESKPEKKGQRRLKRWLVKFGVPGASLLAPLALPTMFTAATLVGTGVAKRWVMLWQVVAIVLWTTTVTVAAAGVLSVVG